MNRWLRWLLIALAVVSVLCVGALIAVPLLYDVERYRPQVETEASRIAGRPVRVGDLSFSLFPWASVSLKNLSLGNPEGFRREDFIRVDAFDLRVKLLPLLSRNLEVQRFVVDKPRIVLVKNAEGRVNWKGQQLPVPVSAPPEAPGSKEPAPGPESAPEAEKRLPIRSIDIQEFAIVGGSLEYIDEGSGARRTVEGFSLELTDVSFSRPVRVALRATVDGLPVGLEGSVGPVGSRPGEQPIPFALSVTALETIEAALDGRLIRLLSDPGYHLNVDLAEFSPRSALQAFGLSLPFATADPKTFERASFRAEVSGDTRQATVTGGLLRIDDTKVAFQASAASFAKPDVSFQASAERIDLDRYLPPPSKSPSGDTGGTGPSAKSDTSAEEPVDPPKQDRNGKPPATPRPDPGPEPVDWAPLRRPVLGGTLTLQEARVRNLEVRNLDARLTGGEGLYRIDPLTLEMHDGRLRLVAAADFRGDLPAFRLNLAMQDVQAGPVVSAVSGRDIIEGTMKADLDLRTRGAASSRMRRELNGSGTLRFQDGAVKGIDLEGMVRRTGETVVSWAKGREQKTPFVAFQLPFRAENGTIRTEETVLTSPVLRLDAAGEADLPSEALDLRVTPKWVHDDRKSASDILVPLLVQGTFAEPEFHLDLQSAAKQEIRKQVQEKVIDSGKLDEVFDKNEDLKPLKEGARGLLKGLFD